jgi:hypothetical protein
LHATIYSKNQLCTKLIRSFAYLTVTEDLKDLPETAAANPFEDLVRRFITSSYPTDGSALLEPGK